jgi:hypothetical protein
MLQSAPRAGPGSGRDDAPLTWVDLVWLENRIEHWIRFGTVVREVILDRRRRRVAFAGGPFAFVRWAANRRGGVISQIDIMATVPPGRICSSVPGVSPGGDILLRQSGWDRVRAALCEIDAIETLGLNPVEVSPDHWRAVNNRLTARKPPEPYTRLAHRAWELRREIRP